MDPTKVPSTTISNQGRSSSTERRAAAGTVILFTILLGFGTLTLGPAPAHPQETGPGPLPATPGDGEARGLPSLQPWVGVWVSRLDPKYRDHPMIQRFNPDLKSQELRLSWGPTGDTLHLEIWQLDRPTEGSRTPATEGMAIRNPADGSAVLVEYGAEQRIFHQGHYEVQPNGDLHRTYEAFFPSGPSRRFREIWKWKNSERTRFEWITQRLDGGEWVSGDVIVDWILQKR